MKKNICRAFGILVFASLVTSCTYSKNFGKFYSRQMKRVDGEHGKVAACTIKTVEAPLYLLLYLYGGLGSLLDSSTHKYNKPKLDQNSDLEKEVKNEEVINSN